MRYRTTIQLDEDIYFAARSLAEARARSMGAIVSELARRGLQPTAGESRARRASGFPTFDVPRDAPPITTETVRAALDDDEP